MLSIVHQLNKLGITADYECAFFSGNKTRGLSAQVEDLVREASNHAGETSGTFRRPLISDDENRSARKWFNLWSQLENSE